MSRYSEIMHAAVRIPNESNRIPKSAHIYFTEQVVRVQAVAMLHVQLYSYMYGPTSRNIAQNRIQL